MNFTSVDHALRWAYRVESVPILAQASAWRARCGVRPPVALEASACWDRVAQAAAVRRLVEELPSPLNLLATALYSCSQAQGPAALALLEHLNPPAHLCDAYSLMLAQYLGMSRDRGGIGAVRALLACRRTTALAVRRELFRRLDGLLLRVHAALEPRLIAGGLVQTHDSRTENDMTTKQPIDDVLAALQGLDPDFQRAGEKLALAYVAKHDANGLCSATNMLVNECLRHAQSEPTREIVELERDPTGKARRALKHQGKPKTEDLVRAVSGLLSATIALAVQAEAARHG